MLPKENEDQNAGDDEGGDASAGTGQGEGEGDAGDQGGEGDGSDKGGENAQGEGAVIPDPDAEADGEGEGEADGEEDPELVGDDDKPLSNKSQKKVQVRMDGLTSIINRQAEQLAELNAKLAGSGKKDEKVWTKDELLHMINDPDQQQYHAWAIDKLTDLKADERDRKNKAENSVLTAKEESYSLAVEKFPDMLNPETKLWKLANKIYVEQRLDQVPDGQYLASLKASDILGVKPNLGKKMVGNNNSLQKQLHKERAKSALAGTGKKSTTSDQSQLDKLENLAIGTKAGSVEWLRYQRKLEEVNLKKVQK